MKINLESAVQSAAQNVAAAVTNIRENLHRLSPRQHRPVNGNEFLLENISQARSDLERAEALFNELTDEAAVDYAAYNILAARAKYVYLLDLAKRYNVKY